MAAPSDLKIKALQFFNEKRKRSIEAEGIKALLMPTFAVGQSPWIGKSV